MAWRFLGVQHAWEPLSRLAPDQLPAALIWLAPVLAVGLLSPAFCLAAIFATITWDRLATFEVAGFTVRVQYFLAALLWLHGARARLVRGPTDLLPPRLPILFPAIAVLAVYAASLAVSTNRPGTAGTTAWGVFQVFGLTTAVVWAVGDDAWLRQALRWYFRGLLIAGALGVVQLVGGAVWGAAPLWVATDHVYRHVPGIPRGLPRMVGFSFEPSYFALQMQMGAALAGALWWRRVRVGAVPEGWLMLIFAACAVASLSKAAWLAGLPFLLIVYLVALARAGDRRGRRWPLVAAVGLLAAGIGWTVHRGHAGKLSTMVAEVFDPAVFQPDRHDGPPTSAMDRFAAIRRSIGAWRRRPILGWGVRSQHSTVPNLYVESLVETGVIGLAAVIVFVVVYLVALGRAAVRCPPGSGRPVLGASLWGLFWAGVLGWVLLAPFNQTFFRADLWPLVALAMAAWHLRRSAGPNTR